MAIIVGSSDSSGSSSSVIQTSTTVDGSVTTGQYIEVDPSYTNTQVTFSGRHDCIATLTGVFCGGSYDYPEMFEDTEEELDFSANEFTFSPSNYSIEYIVVSIDTVGDDYTATVSQW